MKHVAAAAIALFWKLGGFGLLLLGILDSSFIFAPLGNDILVVAMTAHTRSVPHMLYFSFMSTAGSVLGCLLVDVIFRKAGEKGLEKHLPKKRLQYVQAKTEKSAGWALAVASIAPPPFPFTPFVMAASALQYPRKRLIAVVGVVRMLRFTILGVLALLLGRSILRWAEDETVQNVMMVFVFLCIAGTIVSVVGWIRRSRKSAPGERPGSRPETAAHPAD